VPLVNHHRRPVKALEHGTVSDDNVIRCLREQSQPSKGSTAG
jgi:hypothetical protein